MNDASILADLLKEMFHPSMSETAQKYMNDDAEWFLCATLLQQRYQERMEKGAEYTRSDPNASWNQPK